MSSSQGCVPSIHLPSGYCPHCGYVVDPGECPECGAWVREPASRRPRTWLRRRLMRGGALLTAGAVALAARYSTPLLLREYTPIGVLHGLSERGGPVAEWAGDIMSARLDIALAAEATAAAERSLRIQGELAMLTAEGRRTWGGTYRIQAGETNIVLSVAPQAGFHYDAQLGADAYYRNYGEVHETAEGALRLDAVIDLRLPHELACAVEYVPVRWESIQLLIPREELMSFCNDVRTPESSAWVGRSCCGDPVPTDGRPELPSAFRAWLDVPKAVGRVTSFAVTPQPSEEHPQFELRLTLTLGRRNAVMPGMRLFGQGDRWRWVEVRTVEDKQCVATITVDEDPRTSGVPSPMGWQYATVAVLEDEPGAGELEASG